MKLSWVQGTGFESENESKIVLFPAPVPRSRVGLGAVTVGLRTIAFISSDCGRDSSSG